MSDQRIKIVFLGAMNQGKTWLMKVAETGSVPTGRGRVASTKLSAAEENIRVYLLPEKGELDSAAAREAEASTGAKGAGGGAVVFILWNIPGQNWRAYESNPSFFRSADPAVVIVDATALAMGDDELAETYQDVTPLAVGNSMVRAARRHVPDITVLLVLTKCDLLPGYQKGRTVLNPPDPKFKNENKGVFAKAEQFVKDNNLYPNIICTSAADKNGIAKLFSEMYNELKRKEHDANKTPSQSPVRDRDRVDLKIVRKEEDQKKDKGCPLCGKS